MNKNRILIIGNHTCGNRGDAAILRGLIEALQTLSPNSELTTTSRYPVSSEYLLGRPFVPDRLYDFHHRSGPGFLSKLKAAAARRALPSILASIAKHSSLNSVIRVLPRHYRTYINWVKQFDLVVQVGGSFFVDLYGATQFEHALMAILAQRPLVMLGHSVGPFEDGTVRDIAAEVFSRVDALVLRERISAKLLAEANITVPKLIQGADTAWLVNTGRPSAPATKSTSVGRPAVAITLRNLSPFDRRLGISQQDYERAIAEHLNVLISEGFRVLAFSTCTGIDSYHRDDRMCGLSVGGFIKQKQHYSVVMDELNDIELGHRLQQCEFTIGTRLHSVIIAMNFGGLGMALNYEHKSQGIMEQLGIPELARPLGDLWSETFIPKLMDCLSRRDAMRERVREAVKNERVLAFEAIRAALQGVA